MSDRVPRTDVEPGCMSATMAVLLATLACLVTAWATGVCIGFWRLFCPLPHRASAGRMRPGYRRTPLRLRTADGIDIAAWHYPGRMHAVIVVSWGYRNLADDSRHVSRLLQAHGFHVIAHAWRGTEEASGGKPSGGVREILEVRAAVDAAAAIVPGAPIGLLGMSLGGTVAVRVATKDRRVQAVCLDSPISSVSQWIRDRYSVRVGPISWLLADPLLLLVLALRRVNAWKMRTDTELGAMPPRPVMVITSSKDQSVGPRRRHGVWAAARDPKEHWVAEADHCRASIEAPREYVERVGGFFQRMVPAAELTANGPPPDVDQDRALLPANDHG